MPAGNPGDALQAAKVVRPPFRAQFTHDCDFDQREGTMILTTTAGKVGAEAARMLAARDEPVRILVRDPQNGTALAQAGVQVAVGDLAIPATIDAAMHMSRPWFGAVCPRSGDRRTAGTFSRAAAVLDRRARRTRRRAPASAHIDHCLEGKDPAWY
jgi:hypothetical protein